MTDSTDTLPNQKMCSKCGVVKNISEFTFSNKKLGKYETQCKECLKKYRADNKEHIAHIRAKYYLENADKLIEYSKKYQKNKKLNMTDAQREAFLEANREYHREYNKLKKQSN